MDGQTHQSQGKVVIILSSGMYFQSGIREFSLHVVKNMTGLSERWAYRFQTIVDELCSNAIEYGTKEGDDIAITYYVGHEEYLEVVVEDRGTGKRAITAAELRGLIHARQQDRGLDPLAMRGRGLAKIVTRWVDELDISDRQDGGLRIRARKYFQNAV